MDDAASFKERALALFQKHRRRLATLSLFVFLALVAVEIGNVVPRETRVSVPLGAGHADVTEARIEYSQDDRSVRSVRFRWPNGAPESVRHTLELSPGEYDVDVVLLERDGDRRELKGRLRTPAEGDVRLVLRESSAES
jgi:hypothetical protein